MLLRLNRITLRYFICANILNCGYNKISCKWSLGSGVIYRIQLDESACNFSDQLTYPFIAIAWVVLHPSVILLLNCIFSENAWICISLSFVCLICTLGCSIYKYVFFVLALYANYPYKSLWLSQNTWYASFTGVLTTFRQFRSCPCRYNQWIETKWTWRPIRKIALSIKLSSRIRQTRIVGNVLSLLLYIV